jgi:imidazolonepropionase-like amidohydrolase
VEEIHHPIYVFTNATVVVKPGEMRKNMSIIVQHDTIVQIAPTVTIPKSAIVHDLHGKYVYASFIDAYSDYGMPDVPKPKREWDKPQMSAKREGAYSWNDALKNDHEAHTMFTVNEGKAKKLRNLGFGAVLSHQFDGVARGTSVLVTMDDETEHSAVLRDKVAAHYSFQKGSSTQDYPSSLMGTIALLRQTYYDAEWYKNGGHKEEFNISLQTWNTLQSLPQIFEVEEVQSVFRADKICDEFGKQYILVGSGEEYQYIDDVKKTKAQFILPVDFPKAYDVEDPLDAMNVSLAAMRHWEHAPSNPVMLQKNNIPFCFTAYRLEDGKEMLPNIIKSIDVGLTKKSALAALTTVPASMLGVGSMLGTVEKGKLANFFIASGDIFEEGTRIEQHCVQGTLYPTSYYQKSIGDIALIDGEYDLAIGENVYQLTVKNAEKSPQSPSMEFSVIKGDDTSKVDVSAQITASLITLHFVLPKQKQRTRLSGTISTQNGEVQWQGLSRNDDNSWQEWSAKKRTINTVDKKKDKKKKRQKHTINGQLTTPITSYGLEKPLSQERTLVKNATIWTNEAVGVLTEADILLDSGKIVSVGKNLRAEGAIIIDGTGKHVTAGIIDEHSHIAIRRGVNEWTQAVTSEVRIGDVVNAKDVNIYRQLAGGVTISHLLHGSANPVGGQSALVKLRWGAIPEDMKVKGADGFIKFALGENVKQSNWGDYNNVRFPQTRMGVEQVYVDAFTRAQQYEQERKMRSTIPVRRDLELDALVEILNKERFITCHSYIQSEITMLMRVAEQFDFRVNTFTHILEGYKVADKMKKHGAGGSSFSDWWAYKYEVIDAIPYNGAIMHNMGVITAFNSDDAEMARRLNQEAAKAVKYGGVSEEEALKFVTLNPAKLLHVDDRVGSLKEGKDADIVVWSDHPLSIYAQAEQTFVDGIRYFDKDRNKQLVKMNENERRRLINAMLAVKHKGEPTQEVEEPTEEYYRCDTRSN